MISEPAVTADTLSEISKRLGTLLDCECEKMGLSDAERQIVLGNIGRWIKTDQIAFFTNQRLRGGEI